jgi:hypothetical protein
MGAGNAKIPLVKLPDCRFGIQDGIFDIQNRIFGIQDGIFDIQNGRFVIQDGIFVIQNGRFVIQNSVRRLPDGVPGLPEV